MSDWIVTLEDAARALGLKKKGSEYKGPCVCCGGNDRFHLMRGSRHPIVMHCRHGCKYPELMREMESRGLVSKSEYDREKWRQQKADEVIAAKKWTLRVFEDNLARGHQLTWQEKQEYRRLKNFVDRVVK